jgi:hypothetical protein
MSTVKVRVSEFVSASRRRVEESARRSDALRGGELDRVLAELPQELQDRFLSHQAHTGATVFALTAFLDCYGTYVAARAHQADVDDDGYISLEEAARLPHPLQESFQATLWTLARATDESRCLDATPVDLTPAQRLEARGLLSPEGLSQYQHARGKCSATSSRRASPRAAKPGWTARCASFWTAAPWS